MAIIQNPAISRKLQRGLRLTGLPDAVLAPEIVGTILLEDWSKPLSDIDRACMGSAGVGAVVGEQGIIVLVRVGAPAPYDLVVTEAWFSSTTTQQVILGVPTAGVSGLSVSGNTSFTDLELPGRPASQLAIRTIAVLPANRVIFDGEVLASTVLHIPLNLRIGTIGQGDDLTSLMLAAGTANTLIRGGFKWVEAAPQG